MPYQCLAILLSLLLAVQPVAGLASTKPDLTLTQALGKSYEELFDLAPDLGFTQSQIDAHRKHLERARDTCIDEYKDAAKSYNRQLRDAQAELRRRTARLNDEERHELHCRIQNLRKMEQQAELLANHAIPTAFDNKLAKLELVEKWPAELRKIEAEIAAEKHYERRYGDVRDIGLRNIRSGQQDDIKRGHEAVQQMKMMGMMPPEMDNPAVVQYVNELSQKIAAASDLQVPLQVTILNSKEINAFALPGGYIFIQRGLLEAAETEAQLAGVIAHEIAHMTGRHGHRLMRRATIAGILYQAAQIAALIFTGGVAGIGTYYALQYGFYGLGLVLSLDLLGVSRDFEREADQLGVQYAWNAGIDPRGFTEFFSLMASRFGYVAGLSWFRTHPPFYDRMVESQREMMFLPPKDSLVRTTTAFEEMKRALEDVTKKAEADEKQRPSLLSPVEDCPEPDLPRYKPGDPIENLCPAILEAP